MAEALVIGETLLESTMSSVMTISDAEFQAQVLAATQPVLVYFWAPWCGPCRLMAPIMDTIAAAYGDRLKVVKMEIDPNPVSVKTYQVDGVPAFRLIQAGEVLEVLEGAVPKQKIEELINPHLAAV